MQPIETRYNGYRFRSRLEARWAVAFDTMGLKWQYEPEGYVTCDHWAHTADGDFGTGHYLPDFRIGDAFIEVKPQYVIDNILHAVRHKPWGYGDHTIAYDAPEWRPEAEPLIKALGLICHAEVTNRLFVLGNVGDEALGIGFHKGDWIADVPSGRHIWWLRDDHIWPRPPMELLTLLEDPPQYAIHAARSARFGT